jgi:hypothetical protein
MVLLIVHKSKQKLLWYTKAGHEVPVITKKCTDVRVNLGFKAA